MPEGFAMATEKSSAALKDLRTLFNLGAIGTFSDGQLLERFATGLGEGRELAFAALVERHGGLVFRVCRSILGDEHQAADAFQATFLALAHKAAALSTRDSVAPWLHQAAVRAACHDRALARRRQVHERSAAAARTERIEPAEPKDGLECLIHQEIERLPVRYQTAIVLCDLEGCTHEQAARHLGCAVGTIKSRLARGRSKLQGRLLRRGIAPTAGIAIAASAGARAAVPTGLAESTVTNATGPVTLGGAIPAVVATLTRGVLTSMFLSKVRVTALATAVASALTVGAFVWAQDAVKSQPSDASARKTAESFKYGFEKGADWGPRLKYEILLSRDGGEAQSVAVVETYANGLPMTTRTPDAVITIQPYRVGPSDALKVVLHKPSDLPLLDKLIWRLEGLKQSAPNLTDQQIAETLAGELFSIARKQTNQAVDQNGRPIEATKNAPADYVKKSRRVASPDGPTAKVAEADPRSLDRVPTKDVMREEIDLVVTSNHPARKQAEFKAHVDLPPPEPMKTATDVRLDHLERKVDQILEALKGPRRTNYEAAKK
jgi:RNA polymerase sigma factor (sigma-70 family)